MDLNLYNLLKSMAATAKNDFRTQTYDAATLELQYPQNRITVAPSSRHSPPLLPGETRVTKLSHAIGTALLRARNGGANGRLGCSIVVHEGVYIDAIGMIPVIEVPKSFSLEIVGVKDVRLVAEKIESIRVVGLNLTLRNILIFDRRFRFNLKNPFINITGYARVEFSRVKIDSPRSIAIGMLKSTLALVGSSVVECHSALVSMESVLRCSNSVLRSSTDAVTHLVCLEKTKFEAKRTSFTSDRANCVFFSNSRGNIEDCEFDAPCISQYCTPEFLDNKNICLQLCAGSSVILRTSKISNFNYAVLSSGSDSKVIADNCSIFNCSSAFEFKFNSHGLVKNCQLYCGFVLSLTLNVKGEIKFQNNRMQKHPKCFDKYQSKTVPVILRCFRSVVPDHDFPNAVTKIDYEDLGLEMPSRAEQSANTKIFNADLLAASVSGDLFGLSEHGLLDKSKYCNRCEAGQMPGDEKMRFCKRCRLVCYCSKECQSSDWVDHKLVCRS